MTIPKTLWFYTKFVTTQDHPQNCGTTYLTLKGSCTILIAISHHIGSKNTEELSIKPTLEKSLIKQLNNKSHIDILNTISKTTRTRGFTIETNTKMSINSKRQHKSSFSSNPWWHTMSWKNRNPSLQLRNPLDTSTCTCSENIKKMVLEKLRTKYDRHAKPC